MGLRTSQRRGGRTEDGEGREGGDERKEQRRRWRTHRRSLTGGGGGRQKGGLSLCAAANASVKRLITCCWTEPKRQKQQRQSREASHLCRVDTGSVTRCCGEKRSPGILPWVVVTQQTQHAPQTRSQARAQDTFLLFRPLILQKEINSTFQ